MTGTIHSKMRRNTACEVFGAVEKARIFTTRGSFDDLNGSRRSAHSSRPQSRIFKLAGDFQGFYQGNDVPQGVLMRLVVLLVFFHYYSACQ